MARFPTPHVVRVLRYPEGEEDWIAGEPGDGPEPAPGGEWPCYLFLPLGQEEPGPRSRKVTRPQVMFDPVEKPVGEADPSADDELLIFAPELAGYFVQVGVEGEAGVGRWQIEGPPQPFGPPGVQVIGVLANLKAVGG